MLTSIFKSMKVPFEPYGIFCTLNQANRTITLTQDLDRTPVPELIKDGVKSFTESFDKERASKLQKAWPMVEAAFEDHGILSTLDMAHFSMTVSTTTTTQHPDTILKAWYLLKLLHAGHVPTSLAIETFSGSRYYDIFMVEDLCSKFNIRKEEYLKWLPRSLNSLQAFSEKHHCHLFLNKDTITAVAAGEDSSTGFYGLSPGADVDKYIVEDICHVTSSKVDDLDDMMEEACPSLNEGGRVAASCLYSSVNEKRATYLQESWLFVDSSLKEHDISSTLNVAKPSITFSTTRTKEPYIMDDAWHLLELLSTTHVPVCLAIEIMNGSMQHDFIKIGLQKGGLCSIHGIKKKNYLERWNCLRWSLQALSELVGCDLFLNKNTVTAVESSSGVSHLVRTIVEACIVSNECPAVSVRNFNIFYKTFQPTENAEDPHSAHRAPMKMKYGHRAEITCFCRFFDDETVCKEYWQMVEPCLKKYDFSCTLSQPMYGVSYLGEPLSCITVSTVKSIGESGIVDKAWNLLELLTIVKLDAPMAMEILEGTLCCLFIKTGFEGGLCSKVGIKKGKHFELLPHLRYILQEVAAIAGCHFYSMDDDVFIVVSGDPEILMLFKTRAREWLEAHKDD